MSILFCSKSISKKYDKKIIFEDITFDISSKEIIVLIGDNGAGKSTLAKIILGIESYDSGKIYKKSRLKFGYLPQILDLNRDLPLDAVTLLSLFNSKISKSCINNILEMVGITDIAKKQIKILSKGQLQKVLIACSLAAKANVLVLDEPMQGLDKEGISSLFKLLTYIKKESDVSLFIISHQLHELQNVLDRLFFLENKSLQIYSKDEGMQVIKKNSAYLA